MTGYTVHTGSTEKFSEGWDRIFAGKKSTKKSATKSQSGKKIGTQAGEKAAKTQTVRKRKK